MASAPAWPSGTASVAVRRRPLPSGAAWEALVAEDRPVLFKGAADTWPLVQAGLSSPRQAADILLAAQSGEPVTVYRGDAAMAGRFFYSDAVDGFNFTGTRESFTQVMEDLVEPQDGRTGQHIYIGSTDIGLFFPGLGAANALDLAAIHPMLTAHRTFGSIWIGNRTTAATHYDFSHNIAVCAAGRRRFTLFPPDQIANLYPGPLDPTPGGQVVSMVDVAAPDFERFPRYRDALAHAQVADMEPGDVLVYPAMWWHNVQALDAFNILVNYWWNAVPAHIDSPQVTLLHALMSLRDRPESEKKAWAALFDYYVFGDAETPRAHLPEHAQGPLAPVDDMIARRLRAIVQRKLQR